MLGMVITEGIADAFLILLPCVIGTANGAVGMGYFYETEVRERAIQLKLTTKEQLKAGSKLFRLYSIIPLIVFPLAAVYGVNGASGFFEGFWQLCMILMVMGLFDRLFIDFYWVGRTNAWVIPGTEDLRPYIYGRTLVMKWVGTLLGFPLMAALMAFIMTFFVR